MDFTDDDEEDDRFIRNKGAVVGRRQKLPAKSSAQSGKAPKYHTKTTNVNNSTNNNDMPKLTPGAILQACNGSDIHLARGAASVTATSNSIIVQAPTKGGKGSKTKHRFLIMLPGMLSIHHRRPQQQQPKANNNNSNSGDNDKDEGDDGGDDDDEEEDYKDDDDDDEEEKKSEDNKSSAAASAATSTNKSSTTTTSTTNTLGTLHDLDTDKPTLRIPMPSSSGSGSSDQEYLTFVGKKLNSSSKFMLLSCNKKGSVSCKVRTVMLKKRDILVNIAG